MNLKIIQYIIAVVILLFTIHIEAQNLPSFMDDVDDETPAAPIDGFIGVALAAGVYMGVKKMKGKK
ncbi:hypothetical protein ACFSO9_14710 [Mesonia maritima]|uniref:hypothetical protein n=1 Tax=Mesonia maritima TaxID=1793873 RepID=UPI00363A481C